MGGIRAGQSRWRDFLNGSDVAYPEERLAETLERLRSLVDEMRHVSRVPAWVDFLGVCILLLFCWLTFVDLLLEPQREFTNPTTRLSDDMNHINPAHCTETLVELMLGESIFRNVFTQDRELNIHKSEKFGPN